MHVFDSEKWQIKVSIWYVFNILFCLITDQYRMMNNVLSTWIVYYVSIVI